MIWEHSLVEFSLSLPVALMQNKAFRTQVTFLLLPLHLQLKAKTNTRYKEMNLQQQDFQVT